jgi:hypothetical protein
MAACKARLLKPQRVSTLTLQEEQVRTELTLQNFDHQLWLCAFADLEELQQHVADPVAFAASRENLVIGFSDQIPVWILAGDERQVYAEGEFQKVSKKVSKGCVSPTRPDRSSGTTSSLE